MNLTPVTLGGKYVRLEPMQIEHLPALIEVGLDETIWRWTANIVSGEADLENYVRTALAEAERDTSRPFVTVERTTETVVGSTRFGNIDIANRKTEIGWTWVNPNWQRTAINTEAKMLMLSHAFEVWKCIRVEFKTDSNNSQSRNAIRRIGATEEGILRNHMITESGRFRDSVYFSIIDSEWPAARERLKSRLEI